MIRAEDTSPPSAVTMEELLKLTPEQLGGADHRALRQQAQQAYGEKQYPEAIRWYVEALRRRPDDALSLYNLACCYALMGAAEPAARFLRAAWVAGFQNLAAIERDPDFASVVEAGAFRDTLAVLRREVAGRTIQLGRREEVVTPVLQVVQVIEPDTVKPGQRYPLVVGLHGRGDRSEGFTPFLSDLARTRGLVLCVPEAPYALATGDGPGFGYEWYRRADAESELAVQRITSELSQKYLLAVIDSVLARTPGADPENVFLLGFSQGGFLSFRLGLQHPDRFRGIIPIGGGFDPGRIVAGKPRFAPFLVCHSPQDQIVPWSERQSAVTFLRDRGIPVDTLNYEGGHRLTRPLAEAITDWILAHTASR
jgi:predicted esterase